jgi:hypothetical protein
MVLVADLPQAAELRAADHCPGRGAPGGGLPHPAKRAGLPEQVQQSGHPVPYRSVLVGSVRVWSRFGNVLVTFWLII